MGNTLPRVEVLLPAVRAHVQALAFLPTPFWQHPDAPLFASLPGAGTLLAPGLSVKFGDRRQRFPRPQDVQGLAGACPVTERSGQKTDEGYHLRQRAQRRRSYA